MKEWIEIAGFVIVILTVLVNIALSVFGRPKTISEISGKLDNLDKKHGLLDMKVSTISEQLYRQGEKLDSYIEKCSSCTNRIGIMEYQLNKSKRLYRKKSEPINTHRKAKQSISNNCRS